MSDTAASQDVAGHAVAALPARHCANCGAVAGGRYCSECGQREVRGRHTLRSMTAGFMGRVMNLEGGLVHTIFGLTRDPGRVIRGYLAGRTIRYTHPAGYLLISFAAFALASQLFDGSNGGGSGNRVFAALLIPFIAAVSRLLFWRTRLNYAEHLILVMYVVGHVTLFFAVLQPVVSLAGIAAARVLGFVVLGVGVSYFAWAYSRVFQSRAVLAAAGGLASLAGGALLWLVALSMLLPVLRR